MLSFYVQHVKEKLSALKDKRNEMSNLCLDGDLRLEDICPVTSSMSMVRPESTIIDLTP